MLVVSRQPRSVASREHAPTPHAAAGCPHSSRVQAATHDLNPDQRASAEHSPRSAAAILGQRVIDKLLTHRGLRAFRYRDPTTAFSEALNVQAWHSFQANDAKNPGADQRLGGRFFGGIIGDELIRLSVFGASNEFRAAALKAAWREPEEVAFRPRMLCKGNHVIVPNEDKQVDGVVGTDRAEPADVPLEAQCCFSTLCAFVWTKNANAGS